jgi:hypothetical protein
MAVKTATPVKKTPVVTKAAARKAPARKTVAARKAVKGDSLECNVCGLVVTIDEDCGCVEEHVVLCCDEPMKTRKKAAPRSKK